MNTFKKLLSRNFETVITISKLVATNRFLSQNLSNCYKLTLNFIGYLENGEQTTVKSTETLTGSISFENNL